MWLCMVKLCIAVLTQGVLSPVTSFFDNNACMFSYFQRTVNLYDYTSCTLTTLQYIQVEFLYCPNHFLCNLIHIWRRNRMSSFHCLKDKQLCMKTQNNPKTLQPDTPHILLSHDRVARTTVRVHFVGCEVTCTIIYHVSRVSHRLGLPHTSLPRHTWGVLVQVSITEKTLNLM